MNVGRRRSDHEMRARGIGNALGYFIGGNRGGGFVGNVSTQGGIAVGHLGESLSKLTAGNNSTRPAACEREESEKGRKKHGGASLRFGFRFRFLGFWGFALLFTCGTMN